MSWNCGECGVPWPDAVPTCVACLLADRDHYKKLAGELAEALEGLLDESFGLNLPMLLAGEYARFGNDLTKQDKCAAKALANFRESQGEGG